MRYRQPFKWIGLLVSVMVLSCTTTPSTPETPSAQAPIQSPPLEQAQVPESPAAESQAEPAPEATSQAQFLPITAEATIQGQVIQLEVAQTPQQQAMGLMHRPPLPDDRGMLFPFNPPRPVQFWMKNTPSPLDMLFLNEGEVQAIVADVPPCTADPCPTYGPTSAVAIDQVIELRNGRAAELGLEVGDRVEVRFLEQ